MCDDIKNTCQTYILLHTKSKLEHEKNFAEGFKILLDTDLKTILLES